MLQKFTTKHLVLTTLGGLFLFLSACSSVGNIIPQIPLPRVDNHSLPTGQDIQQANAFLVAGKKRDAASSYFAASNNYRSPERERLILQAAELAALLKDNALTQRYLSPVNFARLNVENQGRFRFVQAQLALNDRNYREALRLLPQRVNNLPMALGNKILGARMQAAQSSEDKLALVQELVLQESNLSQAHEIRLNHDRIWSHVQKIPTFKLDEGRKQIKHSVLRNWLGLAFINRTSKNNKEKLNTELSQWLKSNPTHPGIVKAKQLVGTASSATVTPYSGGANTADPKVEPKKVIVKNGKKQVAVLLPLTGNLATIGKTLLKGIKQSHQTQAGKSELQIYDTTTDSIENIYQKALSKGANFVIGPFSKGNISRIAKNKPSVPTLALNYVDQNAISSGANFYQFGLSPTDEAVQMAQFALNQGQKRVAILTPDSSWGRRLQDAMRTAVIERAGKVALLNSYPNRVNDVASIVQSLSTRSREFDAILMAASPSQAQALYPSIRERLPAIPIYASSHVFKGLLNTQNDIRLDGLIYTETPWVLDRIQKNLTPKTDFPRIYAMGMDAFVLSSQINSLKTFGKVLRGKTGGIHLSQDGSLHRSLRWARFKNGKPVPHGG